MGKLAGIIAAVICVIAVTIVITRVLPTTEEGSNGETRELVVAANAELHQAQTAIIAAMAAAQSDDIFWSVPSNNAHGLTDNWWAGEAECVKVLGTDGTTWYDAVDYCYGPFKAAYFVETANTDPEHLGAITNGNPVLSGGGGWGTSIVWDSANNCWISAD